MTNDEQLLHAYARARSESAFGELVARHIDFVYSTALRVVNGDSHLAQDVAQTVFIDLARKAGSLPDNVALPGWLHRHTCYTAATAVRTERRRQGREQTAMEMRALDDNTRPEWEQVAPYLDESLNKLNPADRDALVLRFLKLQDLRTVGAALGISDDAAQKRVDRALEKLHVLLKHRGATLSAAALGTALATEAVTAAPAGLAGSVAATALTSAAAGGVGVGALKFLALTKAKLLLGAGGVALLVGLFVLPRLTSSGRAVASVASLTKASAAVPFSVQGTLTYEVPGHPVLYRHFTVSVSNLLWHVTVGLEEKNGFLSFEYDYDGTNTLEYSLFEKSGPDVGSGSIQTGPVPTWQTSAVGEFAWLAYASGGYFHGRKPGAATWLQELRSLHQIIRRYEMPADWKLAPEEPFQPVELTYYATKYASLDDSGTINTQPVPRHVAGNLRTWDPTTFRGMQVARQFEFTGYRLAPSGEFPVRYIVRGNATNVCPFIPFPALPATLYLQDNRVPEPKVVYKVTDGRIPPLERESKAAP